MLREQPLAQRACTVAAGQAGARLLADVPLAGQGDGDLSGQREFERGARGRRRCFELLLQAWTPRVSWPAPPVYQPRALGSIGRRCSRSLRASGRVHRRNSFGTVEARS